MKHNRDSLNLAEALVIVLHYRYSRLTKKLKTVDSKSMIVDIRALQAKVYLARGNIDESQIGDDGGLDASTDPYVPISRYMGYYKTGMLLAGARILESSDSSELQASKEIDVQSFFGDARVAEISGVVKERGVSSLTVSSLSLFALNNAFQNANVVVAVVSDGPHHKFKKIAGAYLRELGAGFTIPHGKNKVHPLALTRQPSGRPKLAHRLVAREIMR